MILQLVGLREFVRHLVLHLLNLQVSLLLLIADTLVERLHLLEIILRLLLGHSQSSRRGLRVLELALLELEIATHLTDFRLRGQLVLTLHSLLHVLEQA